MDNSVATIPAPGDPAQAAAGQAAVCRLELGPELVLASVADLHARLNQVLAEPATVVLDAAAVARIDTAGLQLLQAFVQARRAEHRTCLWANVDGALRDAAALLGLQALLALPDLPPAHS